MEQATVWQAVISLASLGFYLFLSVLVGGLIWSRTKEKLAVQETLRKLIDKGTNVSPEIVDALRRTKLKRSPAEVRASAVKFRYWGLFLVALGSGIALWGLRYTDSPVQDLREMSGAGIVFFVLPGLFCLAHSWITSRAQIPSQE